MPFKQNFSQKVVAVVQGINHLQPSGWFSQCPLPELHSEAAPLESVSESFLDQTVHTITFLQIPPGLWVRLVSVCLHVSLPAAEGSASQISSPLVGDQTSGSKNWVVDAKWGGNFSLLLCGDQHLLADLSNLLSFHFLSVVIKVPYPYSIFHS